MLCFITGYRGDCSGLGDAMKLQAIIAAYGKLYEAIEILHTDSIYGNEELHIDINSYTNKVLNSVPKPVEL